jgi:hypothetical protein
MTVLFGVSLIYLFYRNGVLREALADNHQLCERRIAQLHSGYQAEISALQQNLLTLTSPSPVAAATETQDNNAPEEFKKPTLEDFGESVEDIVNRKYRFLFTNLNLNAADQETLRQLLIERERVALLLKDAEEYDDVAIQTDIPELKLQLADLDRQIQELLSPDNYERYEMLSDSDNEQHHFTQFTLGINGVFPLNNQQQEAALFARLRHKETYENALTDSGFYADYPLTEQQRDQLHAVVENALQQYKQGFLQEIKQHLDHSSFPFDQYTLVENYTNTEFQEAMQQLKEKIDARSAPN